MSLAEYYPFDGHYLERPVGRLHYLDEGAGTPVLMVHGNPTWSFYYRNLVLKLRSSFRCIVPDHIGCGFSDKPSVADYDYQLDSRIDDLTALMERTVPSDQKVDVVVHDWGGAIGLGWATANAHRIRRLVILNTAAFPNPKEMKLPFTLWLIRNTPLGKLLVQGGNAFAVGATRMAVKKAMPAALRTAYTAPYNNWANRIATFEFVKNIPLLSTDEGYDTLVRMREGLSQFSETPTLLCWGGQDFVFDDAFLEEWKKHMPHAEVMYHPDAGHYILEDEMTSVCDRIQSFLS
ncbi:MAG: alpha/beta fold hydrolase [Bradymonadia bacterium]